MKIVAQLVTWNGSSYIPAFFESLRAQTYKNWELHILDNHSSDKTADLIRERVADFPVPVTLKVHSKNVGFVGGHNALFSCFSNEEDAQELVVLLNQDMVLEPNCFEKMAAFMQEHPTAAACGPRLMQLEQKDKVDTLGLQLLKNGRVLDLHNGKNWNNALQNQLPNVTAVVGDTTMSYAEVFGVSGALVCYRSMVLHTLPGDSKLFNKRFFSYKEDVELAWRLQKMGWKAYTLLDAVAYHDRSASGPNQKSDVAAANHWKEKSLMVRQYSYRNHLLTLIAHAPFRFRVLWFELRKAVFLLFRSPGVLQFGLNSSLIKEAFETRMLYNRARRVASIQIKRWMM